MCSRSWPRFCVFIRFWLLGWPSASSVILSFCFFRRRWTIFEHVWWRMLVSLHLYGDGCFLQTLDLYGSTFESRMLLAYFFYGLLSRVLSYRCRFDTTVHAVNLLHLIISQLGSSLFYPWPQNWIGGKFVGSAPNHLHTPLTAARKGLRLLQWELQASWPVVCKSKNKTHESMPSKHSQQCTRLRLNTAHSVCILTTIGILFSSGPNYFVYAFWPVQSSI